MNSHSHKTPRKKSKANQYTNFIHLFKQRDENQHKTFSELAKDAAEEWKWLPLSEKLKYTPVKNEEPDQVPLEETEMRGFMCNSNVNLFFCACGRTFRSSYRLKYHAKTCGQQFLCEACGKELSSCDTLRNHRRFVHQKEHTYSCSECQKVFSCRRDLEMHFNTHTGVRFSCDTCNKTFSNQSNLLRHCRKVH